jgi:hypothetical protein
MVMAEATSADAEELTEDIFASIRCHEEGDGQPD